MSKTGHFLLAAIAGKDATMDKDVARCVVRLTTNCYVQGGKAAFMKTISRLKRKSQLDFEEISFNNEAEIDFSAITNLMQVPDGVYYLDPDETDWDSDEYGYNSYWYAITWKLVPYVEPE